MEHLEVLLQTREATLIQGEEGRFKQANLHHPFLPPILRGPEILAYLMEEPPACLKRGDGSEAAGGQFKGYDARRVIIYIEGKINKTVIFWWYGQDGRTATPI